MYLLDTNVVSELRRVRPHGGMLAWLATVGDADLNLSAVTLGEIQAGIEITRQRDTAKAADIEAWLDEVAQTFNVLAMDAQTFRCWATLMHGKSHALSEDAMIAATALVHDLTVVTRDVRGYATFAVRILDPFAPQQT